MIRALIAAALVALASPALARSDRPVWEDLAAAREVSRERVSDAPFLAPGERLTVASLFALPRRSVEEIDASLDWLQARGIDAVRVLAGGYVVRENGVERARVHDVVVDQDGYLLGRDERYRLRHIVNALRSRGMRAVIAVNRGELTSDEAHARAVARISAYLRYAPDVISVDVWNEIGGADPAYVARLVQVATLAAKRWAPLTWVTASTDGPVAAQLAALAAVADLAGADALDYTSTHDPRGPGWDTRAGAHGAAFREGVEALGLVGPWGFGEPNRPLYDGAATSVDQWRRHAAQVWASGAWFLCAHTYAGLLDEPIYQSTQRYPLDRAVIEAVGASR